MSYTPILIISKKDLDKVLPLLEEEQYSPDDLTRRTAKFLLKERAGKVHTFGEYELLVCQPEFSTLSYSVREYLTASNIEYSESD